jgi:hypothetical protein
LRYAAELFEFGRASDAGDGRSVVARNGMRGLVRAFANTDRYTVENCPSIGVHSYADFQSSYAPHEQNWFVLSADLSKTFDASCRAP